MELFPFLMPRLLRNLFQGHFVSCASFYTKYARQHTGTEDFLFFLFCQDEKLSSPRKRIWRSIIYISCISTKKLEKIFSIQLATWREKKRHSLKMKTFRLKVSRFFPRLGPFRAIALRIPTCYIYRFTRDRRPTYTNWFFFFFGVWWPIINLSFQNSSKILGKNYPFCKRNSQCRKT